MSVSPQDGFLVDVTRRFIAREETIGTSRRITELSQNASSNVFTRPVVSLKTLYTDFEVRELPAFYHNGAPLQLEVASVEVISEHPDRKRSRDDAKVTDTVPEPSTTVEEGETKKTKGDGTEKKKETSPSTTLDSLVPSLVGPLVSAEDLAALLAGLADGAKSIALPSVIDKEKRSALHQAIKNSLGATHVSNTVDGVVHVVKATASDRREERRRSRTSRPAPVFHHFTLYKENTDSNQAMRMIASHLRLSARQLQFCGTKDKRAVTLQRVAVRESTVERIKSVNARSFGPHNIIKVCGFTQENHGLRLGDARGNHFRIVLRVFPDEAAETKELAASAVLTNEHLMEVQQAIRTFGVINYFGPQRFGTTDVLTSDVGIQFLHGNLRDGLRLILVSRSFLVPEMQSAIELYDAQDYAGALKAAPYYCYQERDVLHYLSSSPNDYLGALQAMARTMAMMYFHAVQSLIWNRMASARLSGGERLKVEVGDLVLESTYEARTAGGTIASATTPAAAGGEEDEGTCCEDAKTPAVRVLRHADDCTRFSLSDVVLPVPGPDEDLVYPCSANCTRADYETVLQELHIRFDTKEALTLMKIFHFYGTYRALAVSPSDLTLQLQTAASWRTPILQTDWELHCAETGETAPSNTVKEGVAAAEPQGKVQAVVAAFSLPPGSYATSVLREFCIPCTESYRAGEGEPPEG